MGHVARRVHQPSVLDRLLIDGPCATYDGAAFREESLPAQRTDAALLSPLEGLQVPPDHRLAALVIGQLLRDL